MKRLTLNHRIGIYATALGINVNEAINIFAIFPNSFCNALLLRAAYPNVNFLLEFIKWKKFNFKKYFQSSSKYLLIRCSPSRLGKKQFDSFPPSNKILSCFHSSQNLTWYLFDTTTMTIFLEIYINKAICKFVPRLAVVCPKFKIQRLAKIFPPI